MDKKKTSTSLFVISVVLVIVSIVFLFIAIFGKENQNWMIVLALFCILLLNLLNIARIQRNKKKYQNSHFKICFSAYYW